MWETAFLESLWVADTPSADDVTDEPEEPVSNPEPVTPEAEVAAPVESVAVVDETPAPTEPETITADVEVLEDVELPETEKPKKIRKGWWQRRSAG